MRRSLQCLAALVSLTAGAGALRAQSSALDDWAAGTTRESAFLTLFRDDAALVHPVRWRVAP